MSVELSPSGQLGFHRPLTQLVKVTLSVANNNHQPVAFKVKTTAPKSFCVRPNSGRIEPGERVEVQVLLQPMKEEPVPGAKCRDKFLVQSAIITPDREHTTLQELWAAVEAEAKQGKEGAVHEQKIRCAYLPPLDGSGTLASLSEETSNDLTGNDSRLNTADDSHTNLIAGSSFTNGGTPTTSRFTDGSGDNSGLRTAPSSAFATEKTPSAHSAFATTTDTDNTASPAMTDAKSSPVATTVEKLQSVGLPTNTAELKTAASNAAATVSSAASNATTSVSNAASSAATSLGLAGTDTTSRSVPSDVAALQAELVNARAEIKRLQALVSSNEGLRQRNVGDKAPIAGTHMQTATVTQEGIPLQMVGAIAAGVFVFTWLFF